MALVPAPQGGLSAVTGEPLEPSKTPGHQRCASRATSSYLAQLSRLGLSTDKKGQFPPWPAGAGRQGGAVNTGQLSSVLELVLQPRAVPIFGQTCRTASGRGETDHRKITPV